MSREQLFAQEQLFLFSLHVHSLLAFAFSSLRHLLSVLARSVPCWFLPSLVCSTPLRPGDSSVPVHWLSRRLRDAHLIGSDDRVVGAEIKPVSGNRGLTGTTSRIHVSYSSPTSTGPATLILKMSHPDLVGRFKVLASGQHREALFYHSKFASTLPRGMLPKLIYVHGSGLLGEFVQILEDVSLEDVTPANFVFGNQVWGVPKPLDPPHDTLVVLEAMFLRAAEQHAMHWNSRRLLDVPWLKAACWYRGRGRAEWELSIRFGARRWEAAKATDVARKFSPKLVQVMDSSFAAASWERLQSRLKDPLVPFTLCHGDFHAANMFVRNNGAKSAQATGILMFDWSEVGVWEPTTDLCQTLISDVRPEIFANHSRSLLRAYWSHLVQLGVSPEEYPFESCWEAFCSIGPSRWIWVFAVLASFPGLPDAAVLYFHDQLLAFVEAHGDFPVYDLGSVVVMF